MTAPTNPTIIVVAGPTASGKSALALALAEEFAGTIINADSMQVYRDLSILTARPGPEDLARAPHLLYGEIDAAEPCSAGRWCVMARVEIAAAQAAGRVPILAGGTGLYLNALLHGIAEMPPVPASVRDAARARHAELGGERFRALLATLDPEAAARLAPGDTQRLIRAYEVASATGHPLSHWHRRPPPAPRFNAAALLLLPPRQALNAACDARFLAMLERGALTEVQALLDRQLDPALPAMKALGVPQLADLLAGRLTRSEAVAAAQQATRHYAKRQYTWFRHQMPESPALRKLMIDEQFSERLLPKIFSFIRQSLLTPWG